MMPGVDSERASFTNLRYAGALLVNSSTELTTTAKDNYNWAIGNFSWHQAVFSQSDVVREYKDGTTKANGLANDGTTAHPWWRISLNTSQSEQKLEWWDTREWAFGED